jgi:hypothetical protein
VLPYGATTVVPDAAASVVAHVATSGSAGVAVDGSCAGPSRNVRVDKGKRPMVETEEENYGTDEEGDEEVNFSPDDLHFVLNRMFQTRKRFVTTSKEIEVL